MDTLTAASLDALLRALHDDRDRAAVEYELLRERTRGLLEWWGSPRATELADATLDRTARRIAEGAVVPSIGPYVRGVARMVFYESRRGPAEEPLEMEVEAPIEDREVDDALGRLDRCLEELSAADRAALIAYYDDAGGRQIDARKRMAKRFGITVTALRIRMHRLRATVESCVKRFQPRTHPSAGVPH